MISRNAEKHLRRLHWQRILPGAKPYPGVEPGRWLNLLSQVHSPQESTLPMYGLECSTIRQIVQVAAGISRPGKRKKTPPEFLPAGLLPTVLGAVHGAGAVE